MIVFLEGFHRRLLCGGLFYTLSNSHFFFLHCRCPSVRTYGVRSAVIALLEGFMGSRFVWV